MRLIAALMAVLVFSAPIDEPVEPLVLFWGDGCPHCAAEWAMLTELGAQYPELEIRGYEVWHDEANAALFVETMASLGEEPQGVPTTIYAGRVWVGFSEQIAAEIGAAVKAAHTGTDPPEDTGLVLPLVGELDEDTASLTVVTAVIGLVDGFNPCSLWAISMLLALVLRTGSRRRVAIVGATFLLVTASMYGLYVAGLYSALEWAAGAWWVRVTMAMMALAFGLVNLKDFWWFKRGFSLTIPERAKPDLYRRMRGVAFDQRRLPAVLAGTVLLAAGVSLLETPCTAGYPLLWVDLLHQRDVATPMAMWLFGLYMGVFLLDELAVFGGAVIAMRAAKLEERHGRLLKLIGGMLMVVLALVLLFAPRLMESVTGAIATFAVAAAATGAVLVVEKARAHAG
jgi:cytochrome c biogenesis protein CcdA